MGKTTPPKPESVGLPIRPFLYTLDQIASMIGVQVPEVRSNLYFEGRSIGRPKHHLLIARDISAPGDRPDWRVAEQELIRWLKHKGFRIYTRAWVNT